MRIPSSCLTIPLITTRDSLLSLSTRALCSFKVPTKQEAFACFLSRFSWEVIKTGTDSFASYVLPQESEYLTKQKDSFSFFSRDTLTFALIKTITISSQYFLFYKLLPKIPPFCNMPPQTFSKTAFVLDLFSIIGEISLYADEEDFNKNPIIPEQINKSFHDNPVALRLIEAIHLSCSNLPQAYIGWNLLFHLFPEAFKTLMKFATFHKPEDLNTLIDLLSKPKDKAPEAPQDPDEAEVMTWEADHGRPKQFVSKDPGLPTLT